MNLSPEVSDFDVSSPCYSVLSLGSDLLEQVCLPDLCKYLPQIRSARRQKGPVFLFFTPGNKDEYINP